LGLTCQLHDATPLPSAVCGCSPPAVAAPDLYTTSIVHDAAGFVLTVAAARDPFATGDVSEVKPRTRVGAGVGWGVDGAAGAGVAGDRDGVGAAVRTTDGVGASATACVAAADNVGDALGIVAAALG
jgi:hypothetical protein